MSAATGTFPSKVEASPNAEDGLSIGSSTANRGPGQDYAEEDDINDFLYTDTDYEAEDQRKGNATPDQLKEPEEAP